MGGPKRAEPPRPGPTRKWPLLLERLEGFLEQRSGDALAANEAPLLGGTPAGPPSILPKGQPLVEDGVELCDDRAVAYGNQLTTGPVLLRTLRPLGRFQLLLQLLHLVLELADLPALVPDNPHAKRHRRTNPGVPHRAVRGLTPAPLDLTPEIPLTRAPIIFAAARNGRGVAGAMELS